MHPAIHRVCLLLAGSLVVACGPVLALANSIDVSLNLLYSDPLDDTSGGTWQLAAKSDGFGIYGLQLLLTNVTAATPVGPTGIVNGGDPAGFSQFDTFNYGSYLEVVLGQIPVVSLGGGEEQSLFYGVGTLHNGAPDYAGAPEGTTKIGPTFSSLTPTGISWAPGDELGDTEWDTAAVLLTGTFPSGQAPAFYTGSAGSGNIFTSVGTSTTVGDYALVYPIATIVRDNLVTLPDYNLNGIVDAADYTLWRDTFGSTTVLDADGNGNGVVDEPDYLLWKEYFGEVAAGAGAGSGASLSVGAVPEPASWLLLAGTAGMLFFSRFSRFRR